MADEELLTICDGDTYTGTVNEDGSVVGGPCITEGCIDGIGLFKDDTSVKYVTGTFDNLTTGGYIIDSEEYGDRGMFCGATNLETVDASFPVLETAHSMFSRCNSLTNIDDIIFSNSLTTLYFTFASCSSLENIDNLIIPDSVTNMQHTFYDCSKLSSIDGFKLPSSISNIEGIFSSCKSLKSIDNFTIPANITNLNNIFYNCSELIDISDTFTIESVLNLPSMDGAFSKCTLLSKESITNIINGLPLGSTNNTIQIGFEDVEMYQSQYDAFKVKGYIPVSHKIVQGGSDDDFYTDELYDICYNEFNDYINSDGTLVGGDCIINGKVGYNDYDSGLFRNNTYIKKIIGTFANLEVTGGNATPGVGMFWECTELELVTASFPKITIAFGMFWGCESLESIDGISFGDTMTDAASIFRGCISLASLPNNFKIPSGVTSLNHMFNGCTALETIPDTFAINSTSITTATGMFNGCTVLTKESITNILNALPTRTSSLAIGFENVEMYQSQYDAFVAKGWTPTSPIIVADPLTICDGDTYTGAINDDGTVIGGSCITTGYDETKNSGLFTSNDSVTKVTGIFDNLLYSGGGDWTMADGYYYCIFGDCKNLTVVDASFPKILDAKFMFGECRALTNVDNLDLGTVVTNLEGTFKNCVSLTNIDNLTIPESVTENMSYLFEGCISLTNIDNFIIPQNATNINSMFYGCTGLISIDNFIIPENATRIDSMFYGCTGLISIDNFIIPENATNIDSMFFGCSNLAHISDNFVVKTTSLNSFLGGQLMFSYCTALTKDSITNIINGLPTLSSSLVIGFDNVEMYQSQYDAFVAKGWYPVSPSIIDDPEDICDVDTWVSECTDSGTVNALECLTDGTEGGYMASGLFRDNTSITSVTGTFTNLEIGGGDDTPGMGMFYGCTELTSINVSFPKVTTAGQMFSGCENLENIINLSLGDSLTDIHNMFNGCSSLANIPDTFAINSTSITIAFGAFSNCTALTKESITNILNALPTREDEGIEIGFENVEMYQSQYDAFVAKGWTPVGAEIISDLISICEDDETYSGYVNDDGTVVGGPCITHGYSTSKYGLFYQNTSVTGVQGTFDNLQYGGYTSASNFPKYGMFNGCTNLTTINIELPSITSTHSMFYGCTGLESIENITFGEDCITLYNMFYGCSSLKSVDNFTIPDTVTTLTNTFCNCSSLESIDNLEVPESVTLLTSTFNGCSALTNIDNFKIPSKVTTLSSTFANCDGLKSLDTLELPETITSLSFTFNGCNGLTSVDNFTIPSSVTTLSSTFNACTSLTSIGGLQIPDSVTDASSLFYNCSGLTNIDSFSIGKNVTNITSMFQGCTGITSIKDFYIPSNVKLMDYIFYGCTSLTSVDGLDLASATSFTNGFYGCTSLTSVNNIIIPSSVTTLKNLFYKCTSLETIENISIPNTVSTFTTMFYYCKALSYDSIENIINGLEARSSNVSIGMHYVPMTQSQYDAFVAKGYTPLSPTIYVLTEGNCLDGVWNIDPDENGNIEGGPCLIDGTTTDSKGDIIGLYYNNLDLKTISGTFDNLTIGGIETNWSGMFSNCRLLTSLDATFPALVNANAMFWNCNELYWCPLILPDSVETMLNMFSYCHKIIKGPTIPSKVTSLAGTFLECTSLTRIQSGLSSNTNLINIKSTWKDCTSLEIVYELPESILYADGAFSGCSSLETFYECSLPNLQTAEYMFDECISLSSESIDNIITALPYMDSLTSIGFNNVKLNIVQVKALSVKNWYPKGYLMAEEYDDSNDCISDLLFNEEDRTYVLGGPCVIDGTEMFKDTENVLYVGGDFSNMTNGTSMFENSSLLEYCTAKFTVLENANKMFNNCKSLNYFISDLSNITSGQYTFSGCIGLIDFSTNLSSLKQSPWMFNECENMESFTCDLSSLVDGGFMFRKCYNLKSFDIPMSNLENASNMFLGCIELESFGSDTKSLTDASSMFYGCSKLASININMRYVTNAEWMFYFSKYLTDITFNHLNYLVNSNFMFINCYSLGSFNYKLSKVTTARSMFKNCVALIDVENINLVSLKYGDNMFDGCINLTTDSIDIIIDSLPDYELNTGHRIGFKNVPTLTDEHIQLLESKGWNLSE